MELKIRISCLQILLIFMVDYAAALPVGKSQATYDHIANVNKNSTAALFESDIVYNQFVKEVITEDPFANFGRNAIRNREHLWVTRVVPFTLAKEYSQGEKDIIRNAMKIIEKETCVQFKEHLNEPHWIKIVKSDGCYSSVGRNYLKPGAQFMSLGKECLQTSIVLHELLHSLGFWHEQSRPDRDKYVEIFWENIASSSEYNFEKYSHQEADLLGLPYDYKSVMHYGRTSASKNGKPTMLAIGKKDLELGNSKTLTPTDILQINRLYECENAKDNRSFISSWTSFGPCDRKCLKKRQRFCNTPDLSKCPKVNPYGVEEEEIKCTAEECYAPTDGHWGRWSQWGDCIPDCGPRKQTRRRKCDNPLPKYGGKSCEGQAEMSLPCPPKSCSFECSFDQDWCGWRNSYKNSYRFKWLRIKGKTFSSYTGPNQDHTSGNGYYIFVEASSPAVEGDKARVISNERKATVYGECISFWYHMFGNHIGTLRVILKFENRDEKVIWKMSGNKGDKWIKGTATSHSSDTYQIIFEAERGNGYQGDIAIDDINVKPGKCGMSLVERLVKVPIEPVGCFADSPYDRALPEFLATNRDVIKWFKFESSLTSLLQLCAEKAKKKGYKYIGIQYYGECWSGPIQSNIMKHGPSKGCVNAKFNQCLKPTEELCTGKASTNFIYKLI